MLALIGSTCVGVLNADRCVSPAESLIEAIRSVWASSTAACIGFANHVNVESEVVGVVSSMESDDVNSLAGVSVFDGGGSFSAGGGVAVSVFSGIVGVASGSVVCGEPVASSAGGSGVGGAAISGWSVDPDVLSVPV
jgi:hypothetical protein